MTSDKPMDVLIYKSRLEEFGRKLGHNFIRYDLLETAFRHASYVNEQLNPNLEDNERLEFLGDAVLELAVSDILMDFFYDAKEGDLSKYRAMLVDETGLYHIAMKLGLGDHLLLGKGEEQSNGRLKPSILANTMEALFGALYLDAGFEKTLGIIRGLFLPLLEKLGTRELDKDFKSILQEYTQQTYKILPRYSLIRASGPAHDRTFQVELHLNGKTIAWGEGKSKKEAEQKAAKEAFFCLKEN